MSIDKITNSIICGNAREKLKELPSGAVSCIITSPPYWALRDYGIEPMIWDTEIFEHGRCSINGREFINGLYECHKRWARQRAEKEAGKE